MKLMAKTRQLTGKKVKLLRAKGEVPAVIYGHGIETRNLTLDQLNFIKVYEQAGESSLIDLEIDGAKPVKVLIHALNYDPVTGRIIHADFYEVKMTEKITANISLKFIGEPPVVKELGGVLVKNLDEVNVECLPKDLVSGIEVDLSGLKTFEDIIRVSDLKAPSGIKFLIHPEEVVVMVSKPQEEKEEIKPTSEEMPEVIKTEKTEEAKKAEETKETKK